jgi:outer membrane protein assembly factor BamB
MLLVALACRLSSSGLAADWNEWRGPDRNGVVREGPALLDGWPAEGPRRLWTSVDKIPGDSNKSGGFGSVVAAAGGVYCFYAPRRVEPIATRTLHEPGLTALGWKAALPPAELLAKVEQARQSGERLALTEAKTIQLWARAWVETNLLAEAKKTFGAYAADRLARGPAALPFELLDKLATIKNREFPSQAALDQWLDENDIRDNARKLVTARFPVSRTTRDSVTICLDAGTGATRWLKTLPGGEGENGASCTPCVVDGRCYVIGNGGRVYCLDAVTGDVVWQGQAGKGEPHCSFIVVEGVAIVPAGPLTGFDARTGAVLWTNAAFTASSASPVLWQADGKPLVIVRAGRRLAGIDARSGEVRWSVNDKPASSTPAIAGDLMAVGHPSGVNIYRLSSAGAELLAGVKCPMDYDASPTILDGHAYLFGRKGTACIEMASGKLVWQDPALTACAYSAAVCADGKMLIGGHKEKSGYGDGSLALFRVTPAKGELLAQYPMKQTLCATPAIVDGRVFCRLTDGVACFDLRK